MDAQNTDNQNKSFEIPQLSEDDKKLYELKQYAKHLGWDILVVSESHHSYELVQYGWLFSKCCLTMQFDLNLDDRTLKMNANCFGYPGTAMNFLQKFAVVYQEYKIQTNMTWHDHVAGPCAFD